ncbi:HNH endonuclease signature motif containing protein [soil metagenome]
MPDLHSALTELASVAAECLAAAPSSASRSSDNELIELQRSLAATTRLETAAAALAAEVAHRSRRELGYEGLAQKRGARTPEALVQVVTGATSSTARRLVRVGTLVAHNAGRFEASAEPWLTDVFSAAGEGTISVDAVDAIRSGLGTPTEAISPDALAVAARGLLAKASSVTLETLAALAREARDGLDAAGVALREQELRDRRYLRLTPTAEGMTRISGLLDPESAAVVTAAVDAATSPRRGGPRFVDPDEVAHAERILNDARTTEQLALDALVELVDVAVRGDSSTVLGARRPEVRVLVTASDLAEGTGAGRIEGQSGAISIRSVERHACDGGVIPVLFADDGSSLNLGRSQRRHNGRQRTAIAARDGGCLAPDCDRPPSWCEVHHIVPWSEDGRTDLADGVLLCRHHHLLLHNNDWRIRRSGGEYWLYPPLEISSEPILLHSKSATVRRLLRSA